MVTTGVRQVDKGLGSESSSLLFFVFYCKDKKKYHS